jgi:hypothetical protein
LADDTITGTPTATGTFTFNITATDANTFTGSRPYSLTINPQPTITLSPDILNDATANNLYNQLITASGGTEPYSYSVTSGTPPDGLTVSADGTISGTPTTAGPFTFDITATDAESFTGTKSYSLTVN